MSSAIADVRRQHRQRAQAMMSALGLAEPSAATVAAVPLPLLNRAVAGDMRGRAGQIVTG